MDERRDKPPDAVTRPPVIVAGARLSPLQEAWSRYVTHTSGCDDCQHIGRDRCVTSDDLYRDYRKLDPLAREITSP